MSLRVRLGAALVRNSVPRMELAGVGKATACQLGSQSTTHTAIRYVWHHILPQACGGKTEKANLASLCDNCHYAAHAALWALAHGGVPEDMHVTAGQLKLAQQGFGLAEAAGTTAKIPREASVA